MSDRQSQAVVCNIPPSTGDFSFEKLDFSRSCYLSKIQLSLGLGSFSAFDVVKPFKRLETED